MSRPFGTVESRRARSPRTAKTKRVMRAVVAAATAGLVVQPALAQSTWTPTAAGTYTWDGAGNWTPDVPDAIDAVANLNNNIVGVQTVGLNGANRTLGTLNLGDADGNFAFTLSAGNNLVWDVTTGNAALNVANTNLALTNTVATAMTLNDSLVVTQNSSGTLALSGAIDGAGTLVKAGTGNVTLSGANTSLAGGVTLNAGTLTLGNAAALGSGPLTINGGTLNASAALVLSTNNAQTWAGDFTYLGTNTLNLGTGAVTLTGNRSVNVAASTLTVGGPIGGAFSLTKAGAGTLTLAGTNAYTGATVLSRGTLALDYSAATAPGANIVPGTSALQVTGAGTLQLIGKASTTNSQAFASTTLAGGQLSVVAAANATANPLLLSLGTIARSGTNLGTIDFALPTGTQSATNGITVGSTANGTGGIIGGWATVGSDWATVSAGNVVANTAYTALPTAATTATTTNYSATAAVTLAGTQSINSLKFVPAAAATIALGANNMTFSGAAGGLLFDGSTAAGTISGTGVIGAGTANEFIVTTRGGNALTISAPIIGTGAGSLTKAGPGTLILSAASTYTGGTRLNGGTLTVGNATALGTGALTIYGGTSLNASAAVSVANPMTWAGDFTFTGTANLTGSGAVTMTADRTVTVTANTLTVGGVTGAFNLTKAGAGVLAIGGASTFTNPVVTGGALQANNNAALGTGTVTIATGGTGRVQINGGVTIANNVVAQAGAVSAVGAGLIQSVGTGQGTFNGTLTLFGQPANGGVFVGGTAAGNELVVNGATNGAVPGIGMSQREGRVIYKGGGNLTGAFTVTNTVIVGATNGVPVGLTPQLGGSGNAAMDLASQGAAGFDQSLVALNLGNAGAGNNNTATVTLGARTLSLTGGDLTSFSTATSTVTHTVTATTGGINFGSAARSIVLPDTLAQDDMLMDKVTLSGTGGLSKAGAGTLVLRNATATNPFTVAAGTIATSSYAGATGNAFAASALTFTGTSNVRLNIGATGGDVINATTLVNGTSGGATFRLTQLGGLVPSATYNLITYAGTSPGLAGFAVAPFGHVTGNLVDTGTAIAYQVTGNDRVVWDATTSGTWDVNTTANWKLQNAATSTTYIEGDDVLFQDNPTGATAGAVTMAANVTPSNVRFNNAATPYTISAATAIGIVGGTSLTKDGTGTVTLRTANAYTGPTAVNAGTLELDHDATGNVVLSATSGVTVAAGATLALTRDDGDITFNRNVSGAGTVLIDPHTAAGTAVRAVTISGNNAGFTGLWRLVPTAANVGAAGLGSFRTINTTTTPTSLGSAAIEVGNGGQLWASANTYANNITITGTGFAETAGGTPAAGTGLAYGGIGAIRMDSGTVLAGTLTLNGNAKVMPYNGTGTVSGAIGTTNATDLLVVGGGGAGSTLVLTGTNNAGANPLRNVWVNGGGTAGTNALVIGANGTAGTLGTGNVTLYGDAAAGLLRFDRSDGYALNGTQTVTGTGTTIGNTVVDLDVQGTGFNTNGSTVTLGTANPGTGGSVRVGQTRANAVATVNSAVTSENLFVASAANNATLNVVAGATVAANGFYLGNAAGMSGTVNQTGGAVNVTGQLRVSHFGTNTSTYNLSGGTVTLTGASPNLTPSTAGAGAGGTTPSSGDNNINGTATATIHGGGVYLGIDGTGVFNHTGGTLTTNWVVLDNRGDTTFGTNMPDGIDRYTLDGAANPELRLRSTWGLIARNASTAVTFGNGTVTVDNTGTSGTTVTTGNNITVPLDATIDTLAGKTTTLNLNNTGGSTTNAFTLTRDVRGTGTLALTGGGTVNLSTAGAQTISPTITGAAGGTGLTKVGTGTTTLAGSMSGFAGNVAVSAGRLNLPSTALGGGNVTVADGATLAGEPTGIGTLTLGGTTGATILFDPTTAGAITAGTLAVNGTATIDVTAAPVGAGPFTVINYTTRVPGGTFQVANPANYRSTPTVDESSGTSVVVSLGTAPKSLTWSGATDGKWDINATANWLDETATADKFFTADNVTFAGGPTNRAVALTGLIAPSSVTVNNPAGADYTFTSTAGNQLTGATGITKTGAGALALVGPNVHSGPTVVGGGTLSIAAPTSLGNAASTNTIALQGGGVIVATAAMDLGSTRAVTVGTGGGGLAYSLATAGTVTVSGSLSGAGALGVASTLAGGGTFVLSGSNAGYTGDITVDAVGTGLTSLQLANQAAVPGGGTIRVNYPAAGASGNANVLNLPNVTLPASLGLTFTSFLSGTTTSLRSQLVSSGTTTVNGPIRLSGTSIVQFNPAAGTTLTLNGNVSELTAGAFSNVWFIRGSTTSTAVINGGINLPTAGSVLAVTDGATAVVNSAGNVVPTIQAAFGTIRLGAANAFTASTVFSVGQGDGNSPTIDLNGFGQTVGGLIWTAGTGGTKSISNSSATPAAFTVNQPTDVTWGGTITGPIALTKGGAGNLTLSNAGNTMSGNVVVNAGTLTASAASGGTNGALGPVAVAGRSVTVNAGATLSFTSNNVFANGVGNANLPAVVVNGGTLTSTRYNVLGDLTLNSGATLTQASTDAGSYFGYQFRGAVTVGGASASTIATTNAKANHLGANTVFTVGDVTGGPAADLTVSAPLADQSGDFASAAGGFTKAGPGTMLLTAASTYTGPTTVAAGVLQVAAGGAGSLAATAVAVKAGGTLAGTGSIAGPVSVEASGALAPGSGVATLSTGSVTLAAGSTLALDVTGPNATDYDRVNVTGGVTLGGNLDLTLTGSVQPTDVLTVVLNDAADAVGGSFASVNGVTLASSGVNLWTTTGPDAFGNVYTVNTAGGDGNDVTITGVPEPTSAAALGLAAVGLLAGRRRRRAAGTARR